MNKKPFAAAAQQNQDAILEVLTIEYSQTKKVLEIGSGTGQHAAYFSNHLTHLIWQATDKRENISGISMWLEESKNSPPPITLDVTKEWPQEKYDAAFAANIAHIMHWDEIEAMFAGLDKVLSNDAVFCLYGPFNVKGHYTSDSNEKFDEWIKARDSLACIRDIEELTKLANKNNLFLSNEYQMPSNNMIICWRKK